MKAKKELIQPIRKINQKRVLHPTGKLLKALRKASGYTQEEIRAVLGFRAASAVSKLESKDFTPDIQRLKKLLLLLRPTPEQQADILAYFSYTEAELETDFEPARPVRHHAEQHPVLNLLQQLFYLFTYQKHYAKVLSMVEECRGQTFSLPEAFGKMRSHLEQVIQSVLSARRLLAQGELDTRREDLQDAQHQIKMALSILELCCGSVQDLPSPLPAFLAQLRLHLLLCEHSSLFKQINLGLKQGGEPLSLNSERFQQLEQETLPALITVLDELQTLLRPEEFQNIQHMYLFVLREQLHVLNNAVDRHDQDIIEQTLKIQGSEMRVGESLIQASLGTYRQVYQRVFDLGLPQQQHWEALNRQYRSILKAHQNFHSWDAEAPELMRAVLHTFLGFVANLARLGQIDIADLILDTLYLRLNLKETHYHWHSTVAYVAGMDFLHRSQLKGKLSDKLQPSLQKMSEHLLKAVHFLEQSPLHDERFLSYTFLEEPVFCLVLLYAKAQGYTIPDALFQKANLYWKFA